MARDVPVLVEQGASSPLEFSGKGGGATYQLRTA
jgi:hypothetical protein